MLHFSNCTAPCARTVLLHRYKPPHCGSIHHHDPEVAPPSTPCASTHPYRHVMSLHRDRHHVTGPQMPVEFFSSRLLCQGTIDVPTRLSLWWTDRVKIPKETHADTELLPYYRADPFEPTRMDRSERWTDGDEGRRVQS